jgi:hypothetical protein
MPALLGLELHAIRTTWFFEWFHLQPTESEQPGAGRLVRFMPRGGAFRDVVALDAEVDPEGRVRMLALGLERRFVDDPVDGRWARDIAQAFLRAAVPGLPDDVLALAEEIGQERGGDPEPSAAALAFAGLRAASEVVTPAATVTLRNVEVDGEGWLIVTAATAGTG